MIIRSIESGPLYTNCYLVVDEQTRRAFVIDAPKDCADAVMKIVHDEEITIDEIVLTHSHWDHTADAAVLKQRTGAPVAVHAGDEYRMVRPADEIIQPPFPLAPLKADVYLQEDSVIVAGGLNGRVLHTPGHTEGSVCIYFESEQTLFSGDTLFAGSVGRTDFPGGSWDTLMHSLHTILLALPDAVRVFPGHGPHTSIGDERMMNPFLNGELV